MSNLANPVKRPFCVKLSRLDADNEIADRNLLIRRNFSRFFSRDLFPVYQSRIPALRDEPEAAFVVPRQHCMNSAHFRITLDWKID
jgi:hypothetical protein